jgi:hypothetical protein
MPTIGYQQTSYSMYHGALYPGTIYGDLRTLRSRSGRNNTAIDIPYGIMVANDSAGSNGSSSAIRPIAASSDVLQGVLVRQQYHAPTLAGFGTTGLAPSQQGLVVTSGSVGVTVEQAVTGADPVYVRYGYGSASSGATAWAAATAYTLAQRRTNNGKIYQVTTAGTSGASGTTGPIGEGTGIVDGAGTLRWAYVGIGITVDQMGAFRKDADPVAAWVLSTPYTVGMRVFNDTAKVYECITVGTSASSGGPTGTTADITDGSAHWKYIGPCTASSGASAILVANARWRIGSVELDGPAPIGCACLEINFP